MEQRTQERISIRVDSDIHEGIKRIAERRYEGVYAMAAREAFRRLIESERDAENNGGDEREAA